MKLSRLMGTSAAYWLNLQQAYDALIVEFKSDQELEQERVVFEKIDYKYFRNNFMLPDLPRKIDEQIERIRRFLDIATLTVLKRPDMAARFRSSSENLTEANTIKANIMMQIATNEALHSNAPKFNKKEFEKAVDYALTLTESHTDFYDKLKEKFFNAGVIFVILPNISGSRINGATKKVGDNIVLMVNDRRLYADSFWFTLFHEIGHILSGDYGVSFDMEMGENEKLADEYARNRLIPSEKYDEFISHQIFSLQSIKDFSKSIQRDPGIVLGRLQKDGIVGYNDAKMNALKKQYKLRS